MSQPTLPDYPQDANGGTAGYAPATPTLQPGFEQQAPPAPSVYAAQPMLTSQGYPDATVGQIRGTGLAVFLCIITLGIYALVWYYQVHDEMKRHTGQGIGGGIGLVIALFLGFLSPFLVSAEVGQLYQRRGLQRPVSGVTGLWALLGVFILIGPIIWFVKTNNALNAYWRSLGAR
jgi:hypothetical protein